VTSGTITFRNIKPHGGDQRRAFEEMCFQLFAREFAARGEAIRREGSGGDAGMEGYIADSTGCAKIGLQAKFLPDKWAPAQWKQIDESIQTALKDNSGDRSLESYVVAVPRELNKVERAKWDKYRADWSRAARETGYFRAPEFIFWGASSLEIALKEDRNRGQLLYWFDHPHFDSERCAQLTRSTIDQLGDRYVPGLHTRTECEEQIHIFLRTERFRSIYLNDTQQALSEERLDGLATGAQWPPERQRLLGECRKCWHKFIHEFGDGISLPASFVALGKAGETYHERRLELCQSLREDIRKQPAPVADEDGLRSETPLEKDVRLLSRNGESFLIHVRRIQTEFSMADEPCLLVSGEAGTGKSHTLAEICTGFLRSEGIVLFIDGGQFCSNEQPWNQFLKWADFASGSVRDFLECFSALAATSTLPGLICIDALNETPHREVWLNGLEKFAAELRPYRNLKLLVSCRTDYLDLTVPKNIRQDKLGRWRQVQHGGLGFNVFEAVPKYLRAHRVRGVGTTPLTAEFSRPLMLKTFCEAFAGQEPPAGTLSLSRILKAYADRKSNNIARLIGCAPTAALDGLRDIAMAMFSKGALELQEREVRSLLFSLHQQPDESKSLYRALLSEGVLTEIAGMDSLGPKFLVRFTFERVWDYFLSVCFMPPGKGPSEALKALLEDWDWRLHHPGLIQILAIRLPEEGFGEILDIPSACKAYRGDLAEAFLASIAWRTRSSCSPRTSLLFNSLCGRSSWAGTLDYLLPVSANTEHPWNAEWLHSKLKTMPFEKREAAWTIWLNEQFSLDSDENPAVRVIRLAETCDCTLLNHGQLLLIATALSWMLTTTAVALRNRVTFALARLLRNELPLACEVANRFIAVDDPYVAERVLFAAASAAIHAQRGDRGLASLAGLIHSTYFSNASVPPNVIIRHYASIICRQAMEKGVLSTSINRASFRPPFRSVWPPIWPEGEEVALEKNFNSDWEHRRPLGSVIASSRTERMGGYGDWGRYEFGYRIGLFLDCRLNQKPNCESRCAGFDDRIARRYVIQRAVEFGITRQDFSDVKSPEYAHGNRPSIERLGKKYQWIAMHEFLGYLSDHYRMRPQWGEKSRLFESARQLRLPDLLDPFVWRLDEPTVGRDWTFSRKRAPWWAGYPNPFPLRIAEERRKRLVAASEILGPNLLLRGSYQGCEWATLSGCFSWEESVPCFVRSKWSVGHAEQVWLFNSYAVPKKVLKKFMVRMIAPVLDSDFHPPEPEFEAEVLSLTDYPRSLPSLANCCEETFARTAGTWFTTCSYSDEQDESRSLHGYVPSPQLVRMLKLVWASSDLDFHNLDPSYPVVRDVREGDHHACVCQLEPLLAAFNKRGLRLVWRLFGRKWDSEPASDHGVQREYWALFSLNQLGKPVCLGGGTWLVGANQMREELPWPVDSLNNSMGRGAHRRRSRS
jgi:hypothetical protein